MSSFIGRLQARLRKEESGFTLIELLVVLVIIGILLAIAVPSYLGFKTRAESQAAKSNVRAALPAVEAFYSDNGTYVGATNAALKASYDAGISSTVVFRGDGCEHQPDRTHRLRQHLSGLCQHPQRVAVDRDRGVRRWDSRTRREVRGAVWRCRPRTRLDAWR